ncbi:MAG TPA: Zn-dependent hydrolase [Gaiellaceae bacterium]|nr:Zn-dependent hydrolase [Gaiellaceae bacterium]
MTAHSLRAARTAIRVDADRLRRDFDELAAIGGTADGGVRRTTFSDSHLAARAWFLERAAAAGLETRVDAAGNHSAVLAAASAGARTLLVGSHLDTVPTGGRYDGALGVVAALEVLRAVRDAGLELPVSLEAIDFTDEEGSLVGLLGSWALTGALTPEILRAPRGGRDALASGLARSGLTEHGLREARRDPATLAGYLELHIEQGPVLERERIDIGIVTAIVGSRSFRLSFGGERRHAGTTPMGARKDAALGAARVVVAVEETVVRDFPDCVATVGDIAIEPGAFNVVPGRAQLALEFRSPQLPALEALETALLAAAAREASAAGLSLGVEAVGRWEPTELDRSVRGAIAEAARAVGVSTLELVSGAGHDAQALAAVTPSGMIFVPSVGGVSHDPAEHTRWQDCVNGANVLLATALALADPAA